MSKNSPGGKLEVPSGPVMRSRPGPMNLDDSVYEQLLRERIIFLGSEVEDRIANQLCAQLLLLEADDAERDIYFYINSPGGSVFAGMAIYDTMRYVKPDIVTVGMGLAASMGQFLLSGGTPKKRYVLPHTYVLMHQGSAGIGGTEADITIQAHLYAKQKREMAEITAEHTGQTVEKIEADADRDLWFTAQEAVDYGLADHILERSDALATPGTSGN